MRILITGSSGFVGGHLVHALAAAGHEGIAVSRSGGGPALPEGWMRWKRDDLLRAPACPPVDWVIHLEVKQHVPLPTARDLIEFGEVNVAGTQAWLDWCSRHGVERFAYFSTIKAVRTATGRPTDETAVGPPGSPYGDSKWRAEESVQKWVADGARRAALILRPAVIYGTGNEGNIAAMARAIKRGRFCLIGRNENVKSVVAVDNVVLAVAHLLPLARPGTSEVFNLVDPENHTVREMDAILRHRYGRSGNSPAVPLLVARAGAWIGDLVSAKLGRPFPINSSRLTALQEETQFSPDKLARTGFRFPVKSLAGL
jgi:nucleoside-diphosphate-sugar epimerase